VSLQVQRLIAKAIVRLLNGDKEQFKAWTSAAVNQYRIESEQNRLHATISEILKYKGVVI
jgi:hypothetical protein